MNEEFEVDAAINEGNEQGEHVNSSSAPEEANPLDDLISMEPLK